MKYCEELIVNADTRKVETCGRTAHHFILSKNGKMQHLCSRHYDERVSVIHHLCQINHEGVQRRFKEIAKINGL